MEGGLGLEQKNLVDVLSEGMEKAKQLRRHLCLTHPSEERDLLLQKIIASFEKALMFLNWGQAPPTSATVESSASVNETPRIYDHTKNVRDGEIMKKRKKLQPVWTEQVKVNTENGLDGPAEDGYSWRKYGQKDILGAKHPRSYYRCTYRVMRHCWATKQVQRSDDDPTVFDVTYKGTHSCNQVANLAPAPESPKKLEQVSNSSQYYKGEQQNHVLLNMKGSLRVDTQNLNLKDTAGHFTFPSALACQDGDYNSPLPPLFDDSVMSTYSPLFCSPATPRGNYYSETNYQMMNYGKPLLHYETQVPDIISTHTSTTNSPSGGMEFSIDEADPNFPFNIQGFFR